MTGPLLPERIDELIAGYVLGNLSSEEAEEFNRLLIEHPDLGTEVQRLQEVLEVLPYALPEVEPPQHLRGAILETSSAEHRVAPSHSKPIPRFHRIPRIRLRGSPLVWSRVIASAAAVLVLALALENYRISLQVTTMQAKVAGQKEVIAMLQQPDLHVVPLKGMERASAATGSMLLTPGESKAVLILKNLPILPDGQFYQLWSVVNDEKIPWGGFRTNNQGTVFVKIPRPSTSEETALVITVEVSPAPTTPAGPMVMAGNLAFNNQ